MKFTVSLKGQTIPITDIRNISVNFSPATKCSVAVQTASHGDFSYEVDSKDTKGVNELLAMKTDLISTLKLIAENNLSVE